MSFPKFEPFQKIPRLSREVVITEKIDGTNAQVFITEDGDIFAGSRTRWITPGKLTDNHGFAAWVEGNKEELLRLGPGRHFGEWWGQGIQRGYGLTEKRWSLFNVSKWEDAAARPACCHVVPIISMGQFSTDAVTAAVEELRKHGSFAAPGFMNPEGVVLYHVALGGYFKKTLDKDDEWKGKSASGVSA